MYEVRPRKACPAAERIEEPATLDERGRDRQTHEGEPGDHEEVDPRKDPEARDGDGQEGDEACYERHREVAAKADRTDKRDGAGVRSRQHERP